MLIYVLRRLAISIPLLIGITLIVFLLANLMPGDALLAMMADDTSITKEALEQQRDRLGLNDPMPVQYFRWVGNLLRGNLGYSLITNQSVGSAIAERILPTLELMGVALAFGIIVGVTLGVVSALKQYSLLDYSLTVVGFAGLSVPVFFLGMLFIYIFALKVRWFPSSGMRTAGEPFSLIDNLKLVRLPALAIGSLRLVTFMRYTRNSMVDVLRSDYLVTARAKGLHSRTVIMVHAFRNTLIPVVTVIGLSLPTLLVGAVYIETIFQWPGMGMLFIRAINQRDNPMLMGVVLVSSIAVLASNLLIDVAYAAVDPRIRDSKGH